MNSIVQNPNQIFQKDDVVVFARDFKDDGFFKGDYAKIMWASKTSVIIAYNGVHFINQWFSINDFEKAAPFVMKAPTLKDDFVEALSEEGLLMKALSVALIGLIRLDRFTTKLEKKFG